MKHRYITGSDKGKEVRLSGNDAQRVDAVTTGGQTFDFQTLAFKYVRVAEVSLLGIITCRR